MPYSILQLPVNTQNPNWLDNNIKNYQPRQAFYKSGQFHVKTSATNILSFGIK
jgi:hypothetical protein